VEDLVLLDVTPLSLGIETLGGVMTTLIERNTTIPTRKSEVFSTAEDNQNTVDIHVLQGERKMASQNKTIGRFQLTGIPPAPRGVPQVEVSVDIDQNGILQVGARDKATGKEQNVRIEASSGLTDAEIERAVKEAEANAAEDQALRETVEARNRLDSLVYQTEKHLDDWKDALDEDGKSAIETALERGRAALKQNDNQEVLDATEEINRKVGEAAQKMYAAQGMGDGFSAGSSEGQDGAFEGASPGGDSGTAAGDEEVVEADYEIVDEK